MSQFWKYTPEEFLKQPVYDRNFPACKHCLASAGASARMSDGAVAALTLSSVSQGVRRAARGRRRQPRGRRPASAARIIGPNGAGKTTLFSLISGEQPVTSGAITLFGHDVTRAARTGAPRSGWPARTRSRTCSRG